MQRRDEILRALARLESERQALVCELDALAPTHAAGPDADLATYMRRTTPESRRAYYDAVCGALCVAPSVVASDVPLRLLLTVTPEKPPLPAWMQREPRFNIAGEEVQGAPEPLHSWLLKSVLDEFNGCFRGVRVRYVHAGASSPYATYRMEAAGSV